MLIGSCVTVFPRQPENGVFPVEMGSADSQTVTPAAACGDIGSPRSHRKKPHIALRNGPYCIAKRPILRCETAHIALKTAYIALQGGQNGMFTGAEGARKECMAAPRFSISGKKKC